MENRLYLAFGIALVAVLAGTHVADAQVRIYRLNLRTNEPIKVQVSATVPTDGCNSLYLQGEFRRVENVHNSATQDFLADFLITSSLVGCFPARKGQDMFLQSKAFEIRPTGGAIIGAIYVPEPF
jgi:hypothetical protein